jgi:glycosyltransferase involved in cell wall biosynthesis
MPHPLITVITAVRNGEKYLAETIASIQAQDLDEWEYIIVDDASSDGTREVVEQAMKNDRRVQLLCRRESAGPYTAANDAARISRGRYLMRTDGDDLQPPDRFRRQIRFLSEHSRFKACVTFWQALDDQGLVPGRIATLPRPGAFKWYLLLRSASIHSSLCIERDAFFEIGGYRDLPLSQDYRLWCDLTRRGWLGVLPEVLSHVRFHENRSTNRRTALQRTLAHKVVQDHWLALTGQPCTDDDVATLWAVGYSLPSDIRRGLAMLDRWDRSWSGDATLDAEDRKELAGLSRLRRRKLLRANLRRQPARTLLAAMKQQLQQARGAFL